MPRFLKRRPKRAVLLNGRSRPLGSHSVGHTAYFYRFGYWIRRYLQHTTSSHRWPWPGILHVPIKSAATKPFALRVSRKECTYLNWKPGGAGSYPWSCRFSEIDDRPSKEICQSFENRNEHARNAKDSCAILSVATRRWKTQAYLVIVYLLLACFFTVVRSLNTTINQDRWNEVPALF